jgi:hypothetical protein
MWDVAGQPGDWNFFSNDFFTQIGSPPAKGSLALVSKKFSTATDFIQSIGMSDIADFDQAGQQSSQSTFPFSLRFVPHKDVSNLFPKHLGKDENYG